MTTQQHIPTTRNRQDAHLPYLRGTQPASVSQSGFGPRHRSPYPRHNTLPLPDNHRSPQLDPNQHHKRHLSNRESSMVCLYSPLICREANLTPQDLHPLPLPPQLVHPNPHLHHAPHRALRRRRHPLQRPLRSHLRNQASYVGRNVRAGEPVPAAPGAHPRSSSECDRD